MMRQGYSEIFGEEYAEGVALKDGGKSILVRNMRVDLTPTERAIVALLRDRGDWMSKDEIAKSLLGERAIAPSSISVHVANLNKKVMQISGRKLVEGNRDASYRIFPNI